MDYGGETTLFQIWTSQGRLSSTFVKPIILQLAATLAALHSSNICHRDLKLTNILLTPSHRIRVIDFGFACSSLHLLDDYCGTPAYLPPELHISPLRPYNGRLSDMWSLGTILLMLLTGEYSSDSDADSLSKVDNWAKQVIKVTRIDNPESRASAKDVRSIVSMGRE